jgi:HEAT repeat protein
MASNSPPPGPVERAADLAELGLAGPLTPEATQRAIGGLGDEDPRVRAAALAALVRAAPTEAATAAWRSALIDDAALVRRRAAELTAQLNADPTPLLALLDDADVTVIEAAAWALGERAQDAITAGAVAALARTTEIHADAIAREAAVAALGALGDPHGLPAILHACTDKPTVRRRAVLALAPYEGPEVEAALERALEDRDWQVRQAAEDLTSTQ